MRDIFNKKWVINTHIYMKMFSIKTVSFSETNDESVAITASMDYDCHTS